MRVEEAAWVGEKLSSLPDISPVLELGSSTLHFRTVQRPHLDRLIHAPLRDRGVRVIHADLKDEEGVDIAGDVFDPEVQARMRAEQPKALICCNMFEHVTNPKAFADAFASLLPQGGYAIVTVPYSYPYHLDPIDTYFRPSPEDIAELFPAFELVDSAVIASCSYGEEILRHPRSIPRKIFTHLYLLTKVWIGWKLYANSNHKLMWLFRPFKVSAVVLRKK